MMVAQEKDFLAVLAKDSPVIDTMVASIHGTTVDELRARRLRRGL